MILCGGTAEVTTRKVHCFGPRSEMRVRAMFLQGVKCKFSHNCELVSPQAACDWNKGNWKEESWRGRIVANLYGLFKERSANLMAYHKCTERDDHVPQRGIRGGTMSSYVGGTNVIRLLTCLATTASWMLSVNSTSQCKWRNLRKRRVWRGVYAQVVARHHVYKRQRRLLYVSRNRSKAIQANLVCSSK